MGEGGERYGCWDTRASDRIYERDSGRILFGENYYKHRKEIKKILKEE